MKRSKCCSCQQGNYKIFCDILFPFGPFSTSEGGVTCCCFGLIMDFSEQINEFT